MTPFSMTERADQASMALPSTSAGSMQSVRYNASQRPDPPDARLVHQIETLSARVELLEKRLRSLGECAVQQYWDGRLHLPAGKLIATVGQTCMTIDSTRFSVVVNGREVVGGSGVNAPAQQSGASLQQMAGGSSGGWQSTAAGNGIENPLKK
jgi:hypothetical protein